MISKELRIGNLVGMKYYNPNPQNKKYEIEPAIVCHLKESIISVILKDKQIYKLDNNNILGLPLTEQFLKSYGFTKDEDSYWINWLNFYLELQNFGEYWYPIFAECPELSGGNEQRIHLNCLKYVHELQNLYFTLTRNELEIPQKQ